MIESTIHLANVSCVWAENSLAVVEASQTHVGCVVAPRLHKLWWIEEEEEPAVVEVLRALQTADLSSPCPFPPSCLPQCLIRSMI